MDGRRRSLNMSAIVISLHMAADNCFGDDDNEATDKSRCTVIRTFWVFFLKKLLWGPRRSETVSYTHLTLPTNREV